MINPELEIELITELIEQFAEADRRLTYCENIKPAIKALKMQESKQTSAVMKEMEALASEEYELFCSEIALAQQNYTSLKLRIETAKMKVELYRTQEASSRSIEKYTR